MSPDHRMTARTARRISLVLRVTGGLMFVAVLWLTILDRPLYGIGDLIFMVPVMIAVVAFLTVGSVVAAHQPANWIGWAFLIVGTVLPTGIFASEYAVHALVMAPGSLPGARWAAWVSNWLLIVPISQIALALGFDPAVTGYGTGLHGMADRLDAIGGDLEIESTLGRGTEIRGRVPVGAEVGVS